MKRFTLASLVVISLIFFAIVEPASAKDKWISVRSKNFILVGNANEKEIKQIATRLEQFRDIFTRLLTKASFTSSIPTTVVVFKDFDTYRKFSPPDTGGYFQPGSDMNYIALPARIDEANDPFETIYHEYVHLLIKDNVKDMPLWFNEGLAEYYSTLQLKDNDRKVWLGKVLSHHVFKLREEKLIPLKTLFAIDNSSPYYNEKSKKSVFYAESWALIHYLLLNPQRQPQLGRFLNMILAGQSPNEAFPVAFGVDFSVIEKELKEYVKHDTYPSQVATFEHKLDFDLEMQSVLLSEAEGEFYLGDLTSHAHYLDEAEKHLKKAIALDPNLAIANASLGVLEMHRGHFAEAKRYLERALQLNTGNYLVHYYYAEVLTNEIEGIGGEIRSIEPGLAKTMRTHLAKAIELSPGFADSYRLMAFVNLVTGEQLDESIVMMKHAIELIPGEPEFGFLLGEIYLIKGDFKTARETLEPIVKSSSTPADLRQRTQVQLDQIRSIEESLARYKREGATSSNSGSNERSDVIEPDEAGLRRTAEEAMAEALHEALRKPKDGEVRVRGQLLRIDCTSKEVVYAVQADGRTLKLSSRDFQDVDFTTYTDTGGGKISCGARKPIDEVVIIYKPSSNAKSKSDGTLVSVEFVPGGFTLKQ
jgi:tetratricopeptide (TPR) repeat protein